VHVQADIHATALDNDDLTLGSSDSSDLQVAHDSVQSCHARVKYDSGRYYIVPESPQARVWLNGNQVATSPAQQLHPGDEVILGSKDGDGLTFKVKQLHRSQREYGLLSATPRGAAQRYSVNFPHLPAGHH
jgi:predicted component of type VI protein secretion system